MAESVKYSFNSAYQDLVISGLLRDPTFLSQYRDALDATYFETADQQTIVHLILRFYDKYSARPGRDVLLEEIANYGKKIELSSEDKQRLGNLVHRLFELVPPSGDIASVRDRVAEFGRLQAIKSAILKSVTLVKESETDEKVGLSQLVPLLQSALLVGCATDVGVNLIEHIDDLAKIAEMDKVSDPRRRVPTGYQTIDTYLDGGLGAGELGFIVAESNQGKSMVLVNMAACAALRGKSVVYFTFELKPFEVSARITARLFGQKINDIKHGNAECLTAVRMGKQIWERRRRQNVPAPKNIEIIYMKPSQATPMNLRSSLAKIDAKLGWRPDLLLVDYLDEMRLPDASSKVLTDDSSYHTFGQISADLIELGVDYNCPVWTASQIQRESYAGHNKYSAPASAPTGPELSHLSRSIQKTEKADVILSLYQEGKQTKLRILKTRRSEGKGFAFAVDVDFHRATIVDKPTVASRDNPDPTSHGGLRLVNENGQ